MTALLIYSTWKRDKITFKNEETEETFDYLIERFTAQALTGIGRAAFKLRNQQWDLPEDWVETDDPDLQLADYQKVAAASALETDGAAFWMDRGTGKTPTAIQVLQMEGMRIHRKEKRIGMFLIVCPRQVRQNWVNEFCRFACVPGQVTALRGGELKRAKLLTEAVMPEDGSRYSVIICSYEVASRSWDFLKQIPWDRVVLDEAHHIRHTKTRRFKTIIELRDLSQKRLELTGSPIANSIMDLYAQFEFLGEGLSGFMSQEAYRAFYGKWKKTQHGKQLEGMKNIPLIKERMSRLTFMISKREAGLKLPPKLYDTYEVSMTPKQAKIYSETAKALIVEIDALEQSGMKAEMTVEHILTKLLRLAQVTSGFFKPDQQIDPDGKVLSEGKPIQIDKKNPKIEGLLEIFRDLDPDEKMIVWACFREDIRAISEAMKAEGIDHVTFFGSTSEKNRRIAEDRFNEDPSCRIFLGNAESAGEGLNLLGYDPHAEDKVETDCTQMVFFSQNWKPLVRLQGEDRAHRRGTRRPLKITDLCITGTIDEEIRVRVLSKHKMSLELSDIREMAARILETMPDSEDD